MELWDWACAAYVRPGASEACLRLQDDFGQNVPLLLWAAWAGAVDEACIGEAVAAARAWDAAAVQPLRTARRALKTPSPPIPDAEREALRAQVKACELAAERILLETLERLGPPADPARPSTAALRRVCAAWGRLPSDDALAALVAALP